MLRIIFFCKCARAHDCAPYENNHSSPPHLIRLLFILFNTFAVVDVAFIASFLYGGALDAKYCIRLLFDVYKYSQSMMERRQPIHFNETHTHTHDLRLPFFFFCIVSCEVRVLLLVNKLMAALKPFHCVHWWWLDDVIYAAFQFQSSPQNTCFQWTNFIQFFGNSSTPYR